MIDVGIYEIRNIKNNMLYIGSSSNITRRWKEHKRELKKGIHVNNHLQNAWNKYGEHNFKFKILEGVIDMDILMDREQIWIDKTKCYDRDRGYNIARYSDTNFRRLAKEDIFAIGELYRNGMHYKEIAETVGVSVATVHEIKNGNIYNEITGLPKVVYSLSELQDEDVLYIARACIEAKEEEGNLVSLVDELSSEFNVTNDIIYSISSGKTWGNLTGIKYTPSYEITDEGIIEEISLDIKSKLGNKEISEKYDLSIRYINRIRRGEVWSNVTGIKQKRKILTEPEVIEIYKKSNQGKNVREIAEEYSVSTATVYRIKNRKIWKSVLRSELNDSIM